MKTSDSEDNQEVVMKLESQLQNGYISCPSRSWGLTPCLVHVVQRKDLTFLNSAPGRQGFRKFPIAFPLGAIKPIPNKDRGIAFQRRF
jgi:hypothetical protein